MKSTKKFKLQYDQDGDILYIAHGKLTKEDTSEEIGDDVVLWRNKKTKQVSGLTILNFAKRTSKKATTYTLPFDFEMHPLI